MRSIFRSVSDPEEYRCCMCLHVRTGAALLGIWQLINYFIAILLLGAVILNPEVVVNKFGLNVSTITNSEEGRHVNMPNVKFESREDPISLLSQNAISNKAESENWPSNNGHLINTEDTAVNKNLIKKKGKIYSNWGSGLDWKISTSKKVTVENQCFILILALISLCMTILMLFGVIKRKPQYLMPFFCLQVFDFCLSCLTVVGYFSSTLNIREWVNHQHDSQFKRELMKWDPQYIVLFVIVFVAFLLTIKAYLINVIWSCYKYLQIDNARSMAANNLLTFTSTMNSISDCSDVESPETEGLLPPKYEDAIKEARFVVALPAETEEMAPPPYSENSENQNNISNAGPSDA